MKKLISTKIYNFDLQNTYSFGFFKNQNEWKKFIENSENGWIWHHPYFFNGLNKFSNCMHSGIIYAEIEEEVVGFLPFGVKILDETSSQNKISLGDWSIPYPVIKKKYYEIKKEIFSNLFKCLEENLVSKYNIAKLSACVLPQQTKIYKSSLNENPFLHIKNLIYKEEHTSVLNLTDELQEIKKKIRKSDYRFYKNNINNFFFEIKTGEEILEDDYKQFINLAELIGNQKEALSSDHSIDEKNWIINLVKNKLGTLYKVLSQDKEKLYGAKVVLHMQNHAHDFRTLVDENFKKQNIGFALNMIALEDLKSKGVIYYELGPFSKYNSIFRIPSRKKINISDFKSGFTKNLMKLHLAEKYFDKSLAKKTLIDGIDNFVKEI
tara:strand:- start:489 stop:1625 length:1137 start_codon:yes stop_codon:yes gene_type:complete